MHAHRVRAVVEEDGSITLRNLPFSKGDQVEVILLCQKEGESRKTEKTVKESASVGLWKDRDDIEDSSRYARELRRQAERRENGGDD